jgi:hypothetical protein
MKLSWSGPGVFQITDVDEGELVSLLDVLRFGAKHHAAKAMNLLYDANAEVTDNTGRHEEAAFHMTMGAEYSRMYHEMKHVLEHPPVTVAEGEDWYRAMEKYEDRLIDNKE